jgi:hypothetical protein
VRRLLAAGLLGVPALAGACASCARDAGRFQQLLIAAMALFPFAVAAVVARVVRRAARTDGATPQEARP